MSDEIRRQVTKTFDASLLLLLACVALPNPFISGQPLSLDAYQTPADITGIAARTETAPADDAVLASPPTELSFVFPERVRLVKLTLRNQLRDWVDISFRYDPQLQTRFIWRLPRLQEAVYYTADWAALAANDRLVRGSFSFAFGPDAEIPSVVKAAEEMLQSGGTGEPGTRFVTPPPTEIIIQRDPPRYDPPFVIDLNNGTTEPD